MIVYKKYFTVIADSLTIFFYYSGCLVLFVFFARNQRLTYSEGNYNV